MKYLVRAVSRYSNGKVTDIADTWPLNATTVEVCSSVAERALCATGLERAPSPRDSIIARTRLEATYEWNPGSRSERALLVPWPRRAGADRSAAGRPLCYPDPAGLRPWPPTAVKSPFPAAGPPKVRFELRSISWATDATRARSLIHFRSGFSSSAVTSVPAPSPPAASSQAWHGSLQRSARVRLSRTRTPRLSRRRPRQECAR